MHWSGKITVFSETALRRAIPIQPGEVFSRGKIATGLKNLGLLYQSCAYVNFDYIPNTTFDGDPLIASLDIEIDEGQRFLLRNLSLAGLDDERARGWQPPSIIKCAALLGG